ncbi:small integral membrane protein 33 [Falco naumanni]|uniref:small integral membrane protein 33 n=1 Tax=Falco naumanni TaxID=148594 RepID=UPI001ADDEA45|nr:small integral membrane protein 33 [Falco naumanni]
MQPDLFWSLGLMVEEAFPTPFSPCAGKTAQIFTPAHLLRASRSACSAMNTSSPSSQLRQPEPQDAAAFTPISIVRSVTKKSDALPMISVIVVIFVLLAVFIIIAVHYGPHLRTVQITLYHEPMPQDLDNGVHLMDWKKLGSQKKLPAQPCQQELASVDVAGVSCQCSCKHHLPCRSTEPNVIEVTYL